MIILPILTTSLIHFSLKGCENVLSYFFYKGKPVFLGKALSNCTYIFTWATSAACPMGVEIVDRAKCRVYDNATDHWYDLRALQSDEKSLHYKTVGGRRKVC